MYKCTKTIVALLLAALSGAGVTVAQNNISSPYSRFGFGDLSPQTLSASRSMGGVGTALRTKGTVNPANPASYTSVDTLTFMFEVGASARLAQFRNAGASQSDFSGSFDYVVAQLPVCRWMGLSFGLLPYSSVGYDYSYENTLEAGSAGNSTGKNYAYAQAYKGEGGFNQIYGGLAVRPFKYISLGANIYYIFGNIDHYRESSLVSEAGYTASQSSNLHVKDVRYRVGLQYFMPIGEKNDISLGFVYEPRTKVDGRFKFISSLENISADTVSTAYGFDFPETFGAGVGYTYNKKLTVAFDYTLQRWSDAKYYGSRDSLRDEQKFAFGADFQPDRYGKRYGRRIRYRVGASYSGSYVKTPDDMFRCTATLGFGLPVRRNTSYLNVGLEYGRFAEKSGRTREDYFKLSVGMSLAERWFVKNRLK